jgi:glutamine synthetase
MEMTPVPGFASANWAAGYGDYVVRPDLSTLRRTPWLPGTALVLADLIDHDTHAEVAVSPRAILKRQVARARALGFEPMLATELEFYLFENSYEALRDSVQATGGIHGLRPISAYNEDYHLFQTSKEEEVMRAVRNGLFAAGIPVENSKGEADAGQAEINVRYSDALDAADNHAIIKTAVKEIAWSKGRSVTFMAKYDHRRAGSSAHVHQSLWRDGQPAFRDPAAPYGMSDTMRHYLAGQLAHARDIAAFLAPCVNSYKRFCVGMFAPTKAVWSADNRTAGFRLCGAGTRGIRVECRIPGADINPYLACAALLAAGLDGVERRLELESEMKGDMYAAGGVREIPKSLREAADLLAGSAMLRAALGDTVVDHYAHAARWEIAEHDRVVTDWEVLRGLERA